RLERAATVGLGDVAEPPPGRELDLPQALRQPHVPDPCDERLIEQRLAEPPRLVGAAKPREDRLEPRRLLEDVRTEPRDRPGMELEHRAVPEHSFHSFASQNEPRLARSTAAERRHRPTA